jgi:hypothetical protein
MPVTLRWQFNSRSSLSEFAMVHNRQFLIPTAERFLSARHLTHHNTTNLQRIMAADEQRTVAFLGPASSYTHQVRHDRSGSLSVEYSVFSLRSKILSVPKPTCTIFNSTQFHVEWVCFSRKYEEVLFFQYFELFAMNTCSNAPLGSAIPLPHLLCHSDALAYYHRRLCLCPVLHRDLWRRAL